MSSSARSQQLSVSKAGILEKLGICLVFVYVLVNTFTALFTGLFRRRESRPPQYYKYVMYASLRAIINKLSPRQFHIISPGTDTNYEQLCKMKRMKPNSVVLEDGTQAHWIGSSSAKKIIVNFHGGGYVLPASQQMFLYWYGVQQMLKKEGKDVVVLFLSYDLAPTAHYPRQLQQAAALMNYLVNDLHRSPADMILAGDSAGANLVLALLSHISKPHPSTSTPIPRVSVPCKFHGIVLLSPWVSFSTDTPAHTTNAYKDYIPAHGIERWSGAFMGTPAPHTENSDYYNQAATAPSEWWADIATEEILIVAGEDEVLIDGIVELATRLEKVKKEILTVVITKGEAHDQPVIDLQLGYKSLGEQATVIRGWVSERL